MNTRLFSIYSNALKLLLLAWLVWIAIFPSEDGAGRLILILCGAIALTFALDIAFGLDFRGVPPLSEDPSVENKGWRFGIFVTSVVVIVYCISAVIE